MDLEEGLQNEELASQVANSSQSFDEEAASEQSGSAAEEHENIPEAAQKVINRKHFQYHEERRKRLKLEERVKELEANTKQESQPIIPDVPDVMDPKYAEKMQARDNAIIAFAKYNETQQASQAQQQRELEDNQRQAALKNQERLQTFLQEGIKHGITQEESLKQQAEIIPFINAEIANFLLDDSEGPLLVKHLSTDYMALSKISELPPLQAAAFIKTQISPKIQKFKKQPTRTPEPPDDLPSGGRAKQQQEFLKGVIFE